MDVDDSTSTRFRDRFRGAVEALSNTVAVRGLVALAVGTVVLLLPDATTALVTVIVIALLAVSGVVDLGYAATGRRWLGGSVSRWFAALRGLVTLLFAALVGLFAYAGGRELSLVVTVALVGVYLVVRGVIAIVVAVVRRRRRDPMIGVVGGALALVAGVLAYAVPSSIADTVIVSGAVASLLVGLVLISWSLRRGTRHCDLDPRSASIPEVLWDWIEGSDIGRRQRAEQSLGLYFEQPQRLTKLGTWWVMLGLSVTIATLAVLADSTAVVIGAMLVAPLMTPILGLAGALVNGWGRRAIESASLTAAGAAVAVVLAYGIAAWAPVAIAYDTNTQITSRVSPSTVDMLIALAAGAAGAFAIVNARVASGIAGVAIAVALVPPLGVVGVSLHGGRFDDAGGAALLFLTNFVAIVLAASMTFVLTGFARPYALRERPRQILQTVAPFVLLAGVVLLPLMLTSEGLLQAQTRERVAQESVEDWLGEDSDFVISDLSVTASQVPVTLTGAGEAPSAEALRDSLQEHFSEPIGLELIVVPVEITVVEAPTG